MSSLKKPGIKLLAADRLKLEKANALLAEVVADRFTDKSAAEIGTAGLRVWEMIYNAKQAIASAMRD